MFRFQGTGESRGFNVQGLSFFGFQGVLVEGVRELGWNGLQFRKLRGIDTV